MKRAISRSWRQLATVFLAGVTTIFPLVITIPVIVWVATWIQGMIGPNSFIGGWLKSAGMQLAPNGGTMLAYAMGMVLVIAAIFLMGMLVKTGIRGFLERAVSTIMQRIPIAGSVYGAATQIASLLEQRDESDLKGMSVVYCQYGKDHGTGILALLPTPDRYPIDGREYYIVYVPTSPIPMTGGLLFTPVDSVKRVDMTVESLMSVYLSMGVTGPQYLKDGVS